MTKINRGYFVEANTPDIEYTIFNHYIIEVIPEINKFYDALVDITLPKGIEEVINGENCVNEHNYFKENNEELINISNICFSAQDVLLIVQFIKPKLNLFKDDTLFCKSVEKVSNQEQFLNKLIKKEPNKKYFFLIFNTEYNPERLQLLKPVNFKYTFTEDMETNEFILKRIKFCIKLILKALNLINYKVYSHFSKATSTEKFFVALQNIIDFEDFSEVEVDDKLPLNWYALYMTSNLYYLAEEYKINDFDKLYKELLTEEQDELKLLNSKSNLIITKFGLNMRCCEKLLEKVHKDLMKVKQIDKYMKVDKFIRNAVINVCVKLTSKDEVEQKHKEGGFFENIMFWKQRKTMHVERQRSNSIIEK